MSMVINLVEDHNIYLCEGGPVYNGGVQPTPITYLTKWKIVGNSEVHTLPYPDGVVLPTGYKRCEYLTFDGNSYINTGVKTANDIGYDLRFKSAPNMLLIGGRLVYNNNGFVISSFNNKKVYVSYGGMTMNVSTTGNYNDDNVHRIILDTVKFQIDNEVVDISSLRGTANKFFDIYLGTWNNNDTPDSRMWTSDIYDTIIYNTQGELWHGIPCLDANDVPCFYDIVSQTAFYNQGSGSFTYKLYPQPTEIWSCGEYNPTDGKYHILVQPLGGSIADIPFIFPLRKVNDIADTVIYPHPSGASWALFKILLTSFSTDKLIADRIVNDKATGLPAYCKTTFTYSNTGKDYTRAEQPNILCNKIKGVLSMQDAPNYNGEFIMVNGRNIYVRNTAIEQTVEAYQSYFDSLGAIEIICPLYTPFNQFVNAPQIQEADSYSMVISQGGKAVEWSSFETE